MAATKEQYETLFNLLLERDISKAGLSKDNKESVELFSTQNEVNKKAIRRAYSSWKQAQKDRVKFLAEEADYDAATNAVLETAG